MKVCEALAFARKLKPCDETVFDDAMLVQYVNEIEGRVQTEVLGIAPADCIRYDAAQDLQTELLVSYPHDKLYYLFVMAMIDFANGEYEKYNNTITTCNAYVSEWAKWFQRTHRKGHPAEEGVYLTAYGIAVKHGYTGTEAEWAAMYTDAVDAANAAAESAEEAAGAANTAAASLPAYVTAAQAAQAGAEAAEDGAEAAQAAAEAAITGVDTAVSAAQAAQSAAETAETGAEEAQALAEAAQSGASTAKTAAETAKELAETAKADAETAQAGAETAETGAVSAAGTAETAKDAAVSAKTAAETAKVDAVSAKTAAQSAQLLAESAQEDAESAAATALSYKTAAEAAKSGAETAKADAVSAKTAAESAQAAAVSAKSAAETAKSGAVSAKTGAQTAKDGAETARVGAETAKSLSQSWAVGGTGVRTGEATNNAQYWASVAESAAGGGVSSFNGRGGAVVPASGDYTAAQVGADAAGSAAAVQSNLAAHAQNANNPHGVTAAQVGADSTGTAEAAVSAHNGAADAHSALMAGKAPVSHTHLKSQITDFPSSMPASDVADWAKAAAKPTYTASEVGAAAASHTHSASQVTGLATVATSGSYVDLANKPTIPTVPSNVSAFTNDAGYLTAHQDVSGKLDKSGGTMTGELTLAADPTADLGAATKQYVDNSSDVFFVTYGSTPQTEIEAAYQAGKSLICKYSFYVAPLMYRARSNMFYFGCVFSGKMIIIMSFAGTWGCTEYNFVQTDDDGTVIYSLTAAADTAPATAKVRNTSLNAAETTPTVNGQIAWTYA